MLRLLEIRTIIFTDLDLKRSEDEKKVDIKDNGKGDVIPRNISDLKTKYAEASSSLSTNGTLEFFIKEELKDRKAKYVEINNKIIEKILNNDQLIIDCNNITLYSQGKINGYYATSFEEAIVLTNDIDDDERKYKKSLIKLLQHVHPKMKYFIDINQDSNIASRSYMYQVKLSDGKSKFSTGLVFLSVTDDDFSIKQPKYIESGLDSLCRYLEE